MPGRLPALCPSEATRAGATSVLTLTSNAINTLPQAAVGADLLFVVDTMPSRRAGQAIALGSLLSSAVAAPSRFPASGNGLWFAQPGRFDAWSNDWLPIGNGYLAGMYVLRSVRGGSADAVL